MLPNIDNQYFDTIFLGKHAIMGQMEHVLLGNAVEMSTNVNEIY